MQFSEPAQPSVAMTAPFEASGVAMLIVDSKRRFVEVNRAACALLGMDRGAIVGSTIDVLTPAERRHEIDTRWDGFLRAGTQGGTFAFQIAGGPPRQFGYFATAHAAQGQHLAVLAAPAATSSDTRRRDGTTRGLSEREREVLTRIAIGETGLAIAHALNISPATVETHVRHCMDKLGAKNRPHAIAIALYTREITMSLRDPPTA